MRDSISRPYSYYSQILPIIPQEVVSNNAWGICHFVIKNLKFSAERLRKTRDFEKKIVFEFRITAKTALIPKLLEFFVPRP